MAIDTTLTSTNPYFDDFSTSGNADKNYLRILFQPGRPVQARELNQIQSAIQDQIDKFGQNIFVEGTRVVNGETDIDTQTRWIDIELTQDSANAASSTAQELKDKIIYSDSGGASFVDSPAAINTSIDVAATVVDYENISGNKYRLYVRYLTGNEGSNTKPDFNNGSRTYADVKIANSMTGVSAGSVIGTGTTQISSGYAVRLHNNKGVYYVKGYFVVAPEQTKYVETGTSTAKQDLVGSIGFTVTEGTKTAINDSTLYDNAQGTANFSAPGADRYTITLGLTLISSQFNANTKNVTLPTANNIVPVQSIVGSKTVAPVKTKYNVIGSQIAKRTFEESGDYALQPFELDLREHLLVTGNRGKYSLTDSPAGDGSKFIAALEPSTAYVKGNRVEITNKQEIVVSKARDTEVIENIEIQARQGSFIECDSIQNLPDTSGVSFDLVVSASNSPTNTTLANHRKISTDGGSRVGSCTVRGIEFTGRKFRIYIDDLVLGYNNSPGVVTLSDAVRIRPSTGDSLGTTSFLGTSTSGGFVLNDVTEFNKNFPLPADTVRTLFPLSQTVSIPVRETKSDATRAGSTNFTTAFSVTGSTFYLDNINDYIVTRNDTGLQVLVTSVSLTNSSTTLTLGISSTDVGGNALNTDHSLSITYSKRQTGTHRTKTKTAITDANVVDSSYNVGDVITLAKTDIVELTSLLDSPTGIDYADNFVLDNGQTETSYGQGKLICIEAISSGVTALKPSYKYFEHGTGDFFSVDSYKINESGSTTNTEVQRAEIDTLGGLSLLDQLDFRGSSTSLDPNGIIRIGGIQSFLPRFDKIVIKSNGELEYVQGDSIAGTPPETPADSMLLYDLDVPAFTDSVQQIEIGYKDNRRYTMRDIGKIDKRVKNLEYYTSLSMLERSTRDKSIQDTSGERFKNGIIVDEFKGHGVGDPSDPGYLAAVEPENGELRPSFTVKNIGIRNADPSAADNSPTGSVPIGNEDFIRLPASSIENLINQDKASIAISVNPFDVASWVGSIELSPDNDEWRDTVTRPDVIIQNDQVNDAVLNLVNEQLASSGTRWNDWNTTWSGVTSVQDLGWNNSLQTLARVEGARVVSTRRRWWRGWGRRRQVIVPTFGGGTLVGRASGRRRWWRRRRRAEFRLEQRTTSTNQFREGIQQFATTETINQSLGERVVDTSFIPFIRSRKVYFSATGLKPNTQVHPFFDGVSIAGYATEANFVQFRDDSTRTDHTDDSPAGLSLTTTLTTDNAGELTGYFVLPNNIYLRFRTGEREFRLVDNLQNDLTIANTYASATYTARGILQTVEEQILSTRRIRIDERRVTDTRTLTSTQTAATAVRHRDPLAQTFVVDPDLYPDGVFIKDLDLFFRTKHGSLPVRAHIVTAENGIPTQKIVPFTEVEKKSSEVFISESAATPTTFTFKSAVHLKPGIEYAIVVLSNSPDYFLWHSEVGGTDVLTGQRIDKNPYTGVALKSQNASTWTPDQNKDFKFTLRYMKFNTGSVEVGSSTTGHGSFSVVVPANQVNTFDTVNLIADSILPPKTTASFTLQLGSGTPFNIVPNRHIELGEMQTTGNGSSTGASDFKLTCTLSTDSEFLTPQVDLTRMSLLLFKNTINNDNTNETLATHGNATARYITRITRLENAASQVDVFVDINRPSVDCDVEAYIRFSPTGTFTKLQNNQIPVSGDFKEVHFRTASTDDVPSFTEFQIKLVMLSVNSGQIPKMHNFRAIATA